MLDPEYLDSRQRRRETLRRAETILDLWLDLVEAELPNAKPDPSKSTEIANLFSICKRILEIEVLVRRLDQLEGRNDNANLEINPDLFDERLLGTAEED